MRRSVWRVAFRVLLLLATAVSLYLLFPSLVELFTEWHSLADLDPWLLLLAVVFEAASVTALWELERIALRTPSWFAVGTAQLAGNAAGAVIPGGAATAGAFAYRLLVRAGVRGEDVAGGLTAVSIANMTTTAAGSRARRVHRPGGGASLTVDHVATSCAPGHAAQTIEV